MNEATNGSLGCETSSRRRAELAQLALDEHADGPGERGGVLVVVRHDQRRQARSSAAAPAARAAHGGLRVRVERRERLVEQQHARVARERPRQRDPLPLAARQLARLRVREVRDAEALEQLADPLLAAEGDVPRDAQVREERVLLEDEPDASLVGRGGRRPGVEPDLVVERDPPLRPQRARRSPAAPSSSPRPTARRARPCRSTSSASLSSNERRGSSKSAERVAT